MTTRTAGFSTLLRWVERAIFRKASANPANTGRGAAENGDVANRLATGPYHASASLMPISSVACLVEKAWRYNVPDRHGPASDIPDELQGEWRVACYFDPDGTRGPTPDTWVIYNDRIQTPDGDLLVGSVMREVEPDQDLHLISFTNYGVQCAFLRSSEEPGSMLAVWHLGGREVRRFLLLPAQECPGGETG